LTAAEGLRGGAGQALKAGLTGTAASLGSRLAAKALTNPSFRNAYLSAQSSPANSSIADAIRNLSLGTALSQGEQ